MRNGITNVCIPCVFSLTIFIELVMRVRNRYAHLSNRLATNASPVIHIAVVCDVIPHVILRLSIHASHFYERPPRGWKLSDAEISAHHPT